jgi:hypothetical protein
MERLRSGNRKVPDLPLCMRCIFAVQNDLAPRRILAKELPILWVICI